MDSIIGSFNSTMPLKRHLSELESHCKNFIDCFDEEGPLREIREVISAEWDMIFKKAKKEKEFPGLIN